MMRALDLFSAAAGGWTLGLHRAGFVTVAACEIVEWRRILYAENNPHVRLYEDVRTVDAVPLGDALARDRHGRPLPVWRGCRRIGAGEVFLMNPAVPDSLDGRYFGPLPAATVIGTATPLYTDETGDGRFVWRAATR